MTEFPWLLCAVLGCFLTQGGKTNEWREAHPPSTLWKGSYTVVVARPCVDTIPAFPLTEDIKSELRYGPIVEEEKHEPSQKETGTLAPR